MRLMAAKMRRGEITRATFDEWARSTDLEHLPDRARSPRGKRRMRAR